MRSDGRADDQLRPVKVTRGFTRTPAGSVLWEQGNTVLLCTAGVWACLTSQFWFATLAAHHPLPFDSSFFVTGVTTVGLAIPTPGGIGGFHKACQLVLTRFYRFDVESSIAVAVLFHVIGTLPVLGGRTGERGSEAPNPRPTGTSMIEPDSTLV
jgi:uncharacterized membrane protein YbhN (UPF0104 family)